MIKTYKPTSPGIRERKTLVSETDKVKPNKKLKYPPKYSAWCD